MPPKSLSAVRSESHKSARERFLSQYQLLFGSYRELASLCGNIPLLAVRPKATQGGEGFGLAVVLLDCMAEDMRCTLSLVVTGRVEQAGAVGVSLWEKALSVSYLLQDPSARAKEYAKLTKLRSGYWPVGSMIRSMPTQGASDAIANAEVYREWLNYQYAVLSALKHPNSRTIVYLRGLACGNWRGADCDAPVATRDSAGVVVLAFTCLQVAKALDGFVFMYGDDGQRRNLAGKLGACYGAIVEALRNPAFRVPTHSVGREKGEFLDSFEHWMLRTSPPTTCTPGT